MIRRATPEDHASIAQLAAEVYADLGDYGSIMPSWLSHPDVKVYVDPEQDRALEGRVAERMRSFLLLGFFEPLQASSRAESERSLVVDMLAIAVVPDHQRQGLGRRLLREAIKIASEAAQGFGRADMRLTVSETNPVAQKLFSSEGFSILDSHHGSYDRGQQAIRMNRRLPTSSRFARQ